MGGLWHRATDHHHHVVKAKWRQWSRKEPCPPQFQAVMLTSSHTYSQTYHVTMIQPATLMCINVRCNYMCIYGDTGGWDRLTSMNFLTSGRYFVKSAFNIRASIWNACCVCACMWVWVCVVCVYVCECECVYVSVCECVCMCVCEVWSRKGSERGHWWHHHDLMKYALTNPGL